MIMNQISTAIKDLRNTVDKLNLERHSVLQKQIL